MRIFFKNLSFYVVQVNSNEAKTFFNEVCFAVKPVSSKDLGYKLILALHPKHNQRNRE